MGKRRTDFHPLVKRGKDSWVSGFAGLADPQAFRYRQRRLWCRVQLSMAQAANTPQDAEAVSHLRPIDSWFIDEILPLEPMLLASARKMVDDADAARDLVQDAFTRVLGSEGWARIDAPQAYMLRLMKNLAIDKLRRARIARFDQLSQVEGVEVADETPDAFRIVSGREQMARLNAALKGLPERCRQVFILRRIEERSPREVARRLDVSPSTLEKRLARAHFLIAQAVATAPAEPAIGRGGEVVQEPVTKLNRSR
jgi:RNA polymerase sigma-70 factor (ECF subfamily)